MTYDLCSIYDMIVDISNTVYCIYEYIRMLQMSCNHECYVYFVGIIQDIVLLLNRMRTPIRLMVDHENFIVIPC